MNDQVAVSIEFEGATWLRVVNNAGDVIGRYRCSTTDLVDDEPLDTFIFRHGGVKKTFEYLHARYAEA